ncbi:DUF397 domain-containing protein [Nocardiopsis sp. NPDC006938]|uniref:DUF397 domain-containing protein n=1 Tax=Nocardiopsis sp. NPDC006938 TaxID=3364337 RepID=UPI0036862833
MNTNRAIATEGFKKSSYSMNGANCVECRVGGDKIDIRDTQHRPLGHISVPASEWLRLLASSR